MTPCCSRPYLLAAVLAVAGGCAAPSRPDPAAIPRAVVLTPAEAADAEAPADDADPGPAPPGPVLGHLELRDLTVTMHDGPDGPRYTIKDAGGAVLADGLGEEALLARFPDLRPLVEKGMAGNDARLTVSPDGGLPDPGPDGE